jgi:hypothetical protein
MKKTLYLVAAFALIVLTLPPGITWSAQKGTIVFCQRISDDFKPFNEIKKSEINSVSWIAYAEKPFDTQQLSYSIYKKEGSEKEKLLKRGVLLVRPTWDTVGVQNMVLPEDGELILTINTDNGKSICTGTIIVTKKTINEVLPEKIEAQGATLETIFNTYKPKSNK